MIEQQQIELFKQQEWYDQWKDNCLKENENPNNLINNYCFKDLIMIGFIWMNTKEGYEFWSKIDNEWYKLVKE